MATEIRRGVLLDTNVLIELQRNQPNSRVVAFVSRLTQPYVSVITVHELMKGIPLSHPERQDSNLAVLMQLMVEFGNRGGKIKDIGIKEAVVAARLVATRQKDGDELELADGLIAGTAKVHELCVATRNTKDFQDLGISVLNPWEDVQ